MKSSSQSRRKKRSQEGVKYGEIESFLCLRRSSASFILCSRPSLKEEESAWFPIIIALNSSGLKKYSYRHVFKATAMHYLVNPVWKNIIALCIIFIGVNAPKWKSPKTEFLKIERSLKNFHEFFRLFFILKVFLRRSNTNTKEGAVADDGVVVTLILGSLLGYMLEQLQLHRSFFFSTP